MPAGAVVCCVIGGGVHLIRDMAGNAGDANPDPNSEEGGRPAHNILIRNCHTFSKEIPF